MRKSRVNLPNRCYHLISRVAHRAFFLDDGERKRLVDLVRRVSRFSGVKLLSCGVMSNPVNAGIVCWPDKYEWRGIMGQTPVVRFEWWGCSDCDITSV